MQLTILSTYFWVRKWLLFRWQLILMMLQKSKTLPYSGLLSNLLLPWWFWIPGSISCIGTCITTSSCTAISIPSTTGLLSLMPLGLSTTIHWRGLFSIQLVGPYHFSYLACHPGPRFSSSRLQPSRRWMITVASGYRGTSSTSSSKITRHTMMFTTSFMAPSTTSPSRSLLRGTGFWGLTCPTRWSNVKVVGLRQDLRRNWKMIDQIPEFE